MNEAINSTGVAAVLFNVNINIRISLPKLPEENGTRLCKSGFLSPKPVALMSTPSFYRRSELKLFSRGFKQNLLHTFFSNKTLAFVLYIDTGFEPSFLPFIEISSFSSMLCRNQIFMISYPF